jgi:thiosulfate dehydrogenase
MGWAKTCGAGGWPGVFVIAVMALSGATASWSLTASPMETGSTIAHFGMIQHGTRACASCHGADGEGDRAQNGPRLAGQDADYLERQLLAFSHGDRNSFVMQSVARTLNDDQRAAVARYYASLPAVTDAKPRKPDSLALGRAIAGQGDWSRKVPACAS